MKYLFLLLPYACLFAQPRGVQTMSGLAELSESGQTLTITNSDKAILHWEDFSIAKGEITRFVQPDEHSSVLNRVTGPDISKIMGRLESNGSVVLINERGLIVGPDGVIDTAGFIGSTFDVLDESFLKGKELLFEGEGQGDIVHMGHINARGGQIYLKTSRDAIVEGTINAPRASVTLEGGRMILREEALVDVSDKNAPGEVNLYASVIRLEKGSEVKADSVISDAGNIMVMSERETHFHGDISAQSVRGKGGTAEVSSRTHLHASGHADLRSKEACDGLFILDPGPVDIVSGPNTAPPASMDTFNDGYINAQLGLSSLTISTANSTALGDPTLTVNGAVSISWSTPNTLTLIAGKQISILAGASISSTNAGGSAFTALDLQSNLDTTPFSGNFLGISIGAATLSTVDGSIKMKGLGGNSGNSNDGINCNGASLTSTGLGNLTLVGLGSASGVSSNRGVHILGSSSITLGPASSGSLTLRGTASGDGTGDSNQGVLLQGTTTIESNSTLSSPGRIRIIGVGGNGTNDDIGVLLTDDVNVSSVNGHIAMLGEGAGVGGQNIGVLINTTVPVTTTGSGNIILEGVGGTSGAGVRINGSSTVSTSDTGNIRFIGSGGDAGVQGIDIEPGGSVLSTGTGKITFEGTGAPSGGSNGGVRIAGSVTSDSGAILITGAVTGTGTTGVNISEGGVVSTTASAPIVVKANSGDVILNGPAFITGGTSPVIVNSHRDVVLTGGTAVTQPAVIELGTGDAIFNIGRDLILTGGQMADSEVQIGARSAASSAKIIFNGVGGNVRLTAPDLSSYALIGHGDASFTGDLDGRIAFNSVGGNIAVLGATGGAGAFGFAQIGHADFTASTLSGNIVMTANGNIRLVGGNAGVSTNARIGHGGLGNAASFGSSTMQLIAGRNLDMLSRSGEAQIQSFNGNLTLVVDNLFPSRPDFGLGSFVINSLLTATGELRIYTVSPDQNVINDQINGVNFVEGLFNVDDALQQFSTYFPRGTYEGASYKFYYKVGTETFQDIQSPAITALTVANAQLTDLLPIFRYMRLANYPVYHGEFCEFDYALEFHCNPELAPYGSFIFEDDIYWIDAVR